eukprot:14221002-Heterocapsa_arctica.AAC.1
MSAKKDLDIAEKKDDYKKYYEQIEHEERLEAEAAKTARKSARKAAKAARKADKKKPEEQKADPEPHTKNEQIGSETMDIAEKKDDYE